MLIYTMTITKGFEMPRRSRMYLSGLPYPIVQRGNNREACFYEIEDYEHYLNYLSNSLPSVIRFRVAR